MKIEPAVIAGAIDIWGSVGAQILRRANWSIYQVKKGFFELWSVISRCPVALPKNWSFQISAGLFPLVDK